MVKQHPLFELFGSLATSLDLIIELLLESALMRVIFSRSGNARDMRSKGAWSE